MSCRNAGNNDPVWLSMEVHSKVVGTSNLFRTSFAAQLHSYMYKAYIFISLRMCKNTCLCHIPLLEMVTNEAYDFQ